MADIDGIITYYQAPKYYRFRNIIKPLYSFFELYNPRGGLSDSPFYTYKDIKIFIPGDTNQWMYKVQVNNCPLHKQRIMIASVYKPHV